MINEWLKKFKEYWESGNPEKVLSLFTDDVIYFETPFKQLMNKSEILNEWKGVLNQENILINYAVFSETGNKGAVTWDLTYDIDGTTHKVQGTYLVELNKNGSCKYFQQTCETE